MEAVVMEGEAVVMEGEAAVTDLAGEVADTDSVAVMALAGDVADTDSVALDSMAVMALAGEVAGTPLWEVVGTPSAAVVALSDSPDVSTAATLVRQSVGREDFRLEVLLVGEITTASATGISVDAIATFAIVGFAILMGTFSLSASLALDIKIITHITTHTRITTTMGI